MEYNKIIETFRDDEYPMMQGKIYLDHGGTTIYARSLVEQFSKKMLSNLYGNPHSASDPAKLSGREVDSIREATLQFFRADPEHFDIIFTANATASIKLVAESFQDLASASSTSGTFWYGYHKDAHTSLVGVRELAQSHCFGSDEEVENWLNGSHIANVQNGAGLPGLFAYPGQSNMTGRRLPLSWTRKLRTSKRPQHQNTYSLLDAAALATTTQLDYSDPEAAPDFTALSFYKIFGFPDLGALIVRRKSGHILTWRRYFGGGTVNMLTVLHKPTVQRKETSLHDGLEDGTLPFHSIIALGCAIDVHKKLYGSMSVVSSHTSYLARRLYLGMTSLRHFNGLPVCIIHNDGLTSCPYEDPKTQGATIAFNVVCSDGTFIGHSIVERLANNEGIHVRSGGLCNAGGVASYLKVEPWQFKRAWSAGYRCGESGPLEIISGKPTGVVRVSLGAMSTLLDVDTFLDFMAVTFEEAPKLRTKVEDQHGVDSGQVALLQCDSGFHSRATSDCSTSVPHRSSSLISSEQAKPSAHPQRSFSGGMDKNGEYQMAQSIHVPKKRSVTVFRNEPSSHDLRLISAMDMRFPTLNMRKEERSRVNGDAYQAGNKKHRSIFKFWQCRRSASGRTI